MQDDTYYKDGVARVIELLRDAFGDQFKAYFNGQPQEIPESMLPCIMVSETTGVIESGATGTDDITETIIIIVLLNRKDDIDADPEKDLTEFKLRKLVKGQYPQGHAKAGQYMEQSLMYAIRTYITMMDSVVNSRIETDFDVNIRGENVLTQEAYVAITLERMAIVPSRT